MPHAVASPGLQALILCGPGSSFPTFTANPDEHPKALLPIANRPMVWYPINLCYRAGITDITLICPPSAAEALGSALNTDPFLTSLPHPRPTLLAPQGLDQNTGTAQILRLPDVQDTVKTDFLVLPCDLVCELPPDLIVQAWMVKAASLPDLLGDTRKQSRDQPRSGGLGVWYPTTTATPVVKGEETDFVAITPLPSKPLAPGPRDSLLADISKVVYSMPTDSLNDLVEEKGGFPIRHALATRHSRVRMLTTHRDAHIYVFPRWVMQLVAKNKHFEVIGEDIVGWWAKAGWQAGLPAKLGLNRILSRDTDSSYARPYQGDTPSPTGEPASPNPSASPCKEQDGPLSSVTAKDKAGGLEEPGPTAEEKKHVAIAKTPALPTDNNKHHASTALVPPMLAYVVPSPLPSVHTDISNHKAGGSQTQAPAINAEPLIRRVDTAQLLLGVSLQLARLPSIEEAEAGSTAPSLFAHARKVAYPDGVRPRANITHGDSLVGDSVAVLERASVRESVVGAGCQIGEGARLSQCLLMDGAIVGSGCRLTRCVLGRRSEVGEGSTLTGCEVQENLLVEPRTEAKDEKFMSSSGLEATEEEMEMFGGGEDGG